MLTEALGLLGHEAVAVHDGLAAVSAALEMAPDIVLLDIGLPGIDGYEVARRLKARPETAQMLLVALTGWGQERDRQRAKEAGFDDHWVKPVDLEQLQSLAHRR